MDLGLTGRRALVVGASKGIGRAIAAELAAEGARVALTSRSAQRATAAASEVGAAAGLTWDTADVDGAAGLVEIAERELGGALDVLVCNTGGPPGGPDPLAFGRDQWEEAYRSLVLAPMALVQRVVPGMRERRWGRILNVVGTTVREPSPGLMLSSAHRSGTVAAFKTIARHVAADGVTLNNLLPGLVATDRLAELMGSWEGAEEAARQRIPAGHLGRPEDLGAAAAFLCSDRAGFITGQSLAVDGGMLQSI